MHPEIMRDSAGDCPICGMALVPIAGTGMGAGAGADASADQGEPDDSELRDLARRLRVGLCWRSRGGGGDVAHGRHS